MSRVYLKRSMTERTWEKVDRRGADDCWPWTAALDAAGYGRIGDERGAMKYAHRVVYELAVGPIPEGLQIDHLCRNRGCVNPAHLEPVTAAENKRRGDSPCAVNARREACQRGHEFTAENTILRAGGKRECRTCANDGQRARWHDRQRKAIAR